MYSHSSGREKSLRLGAVCGKAKTLINVRSYKYLVQLSPWKFQEFSILFSKQIQYNFYTSDKNGLTFILVDSKEIIMAESNKKEKAVAEVTTLDKKLGDGEEYFAVAHIFASFNDTFVHITDLSGNSNLFLYLLLWIKFFINFV